MSSSLDIDSLSQKNHPPAYWIVPIVLGVVALVIICWVCIACTTTISRQKAKRNRERQQQLLAAQRQQEKMNILNKEAKGPATPKTDGSGSKQPIIIQAPPAGKPFQQGYSHYPIVPAYTAVPTNAYSVGYVPQQLNGNPYGTYTSAAYFAQPVSQQGGAQQIPIAVQPFNLQQMNPQQQQMMQQQQQQIMQQQQQQMMQQQQPQHQMIQPPPQQINQSQGFTHQVVPEQRQENMIPTQSTNLPPQQTIQPPPVQQQYPSSSDQFGSQGYIFGGPGTGVQSTGNAPSNTYRPGVAAQPGYNQTQQATSATNSSFSLPPESMKYALQSEQKKNADLQDRIQWLQHALAVKQEGSHVM